MENNEDNFNPAYWRRMTRNFSRGLKVSELVMDWGYAWEDLERMTDEQVDLFYGLATLMVKSPDVQDFIDRMLNDQRRVRWELNWTESDEEWFMNQGEELWECGSCVSTVATEGEGEEHVPIVID